MASTRSTSAATCGRRRKSRTRSLLSEEEDVERRGEFIREHFFNTPELKALVEHLPNARIAALKRGGHDPLKVYAAYKAAVEHKGAADRHPRQDGEGLRRSRHRGRRQEHHAPVEEARGRDRDASRTWLPRRSRKTADGRRTCASSATASNSPSPTTNSATSRSTARADDSPEMKYLRDRRRALGGVQPFRNTEFMPSPAAGRKASRGSTRARVAGKGQSTTLAWVVPDDAS